MSKKSSTNADAWGKLSRRVTRCQKCTRLREHCKTVAIKKRKAYQDQKYWGKPVPNFGAPNSSLVIVGLAPGAHGANRTGRMFTGDRSGDWLYRALHKSGFANQAESIDLSDDLELVDCTITNICRCAPPDNKPNRDELSACQPYFAQTLELCQPKVILALGGLAWKATISTLVEIHWMQRIRPRPKFSHGGSIKISESCQLFGSYHPSQQNTFTGRLTESMLDNVFVKVKNSINN